MKKCRKILLLLAAAVFTFALFALTACGGGKGGDDKLRVTLDKTSITLKAGATETLNATVTGSDDGVEWSVTLGNNTVITIAPNGSACTITAVAEGNAKVKATVGEKSVECTVRVNPADSGHEDEVSVSLSKTKLTLKPEETATLTATVENSEDAVQWAVDPDDDSIISVIADGNSCTVTAVAEGTATITAAVGGKTATCAVTVSEEDIGGDEESVALSKSALTLKVGENDTITATVENSEDAVQWAVVPVDNSIVSISANGNECTVTAVKAGNATIRATIGEVYAECAITVNEEGGGVIPGLPEITEWTSVGDAIYGNEDGIHIYHHIYLNDTLEKQYDFDSYEVVGVTLDGASGTVLGQEPFNADAAAAHNYDVKVRIEGTKYQTTVITIAFKKGGETVATGIYTRVGDKEIVLSDETLSVSKDGTGTVSVIKVNGSTNLSDLTIAWSIADAEGEGVATIPVNSNGSSVEITAVAVGKATLTCTIGTGANAFSADCLITVVAGAVEEEKPLDVSDKLYEQEVYGNWNINIRLDCDIELGGKIDSVEVTATVDGEPANVTVHEVYGGGPKYVKIGVSQDWTHSYEFTINYKNVAGKVIATGTFVKAAERNLMLNPTTLNLTLGDGGTATGTIAATTSGPVEGNVSWSIDNDGIATIAENGDGSITVTAIAKGAAVITATVDGLTKTCTVNVLEEGEEVTAPTVTVARIQEVYGGDVHCGVVLDGSDDSADTYAEVAGKFAYVKVNGVKNNDMKDMFVFGADGSYRVNVYMGGPVQKGVDYVFELCDADGNVLLKTVALQWN